MIDQRMPLVSEEEQVNFGAPFTDPSEHRKVGDSA